MSVVLVAAYVVVAAVAQQAWLAALAALFFMLVSAFGATAFLQPPEAQMAGNEAQLASTRSDNEPARSGVSLVDKFADSQTK